MFYAEVVYEGCLSGTICSGLCFAFKTKAMRDAWVLQNNDHYFVEKKWDAEQFYQPFHALSSAAARKKYPNKNCFEEKSVYVHRIINDLSDKW